MSEFAKEIIRVNIEDEMRQSYLDYAMSVIVGRALPDVRDGLKPVHRRVLFAMNELGAHSNKPYYKSARIVGDVIGKYHPHGDASVYDTLVRMAQPFSLRYMLVDGQGNFGSVDGDPPAAMRYTEVRLARLAEELLTDLEKDTVDWQENYDGTLEEPKVLPALLPNLLLNGATGIAVGMATNIPPHNIVDLCGAINLLIEKWEAIDDVSLDDLVKIVTGPDFPTGGLIIGREGIQQMYATGRGRLVIRGVADIEEMKKADRFQIVVTELPYQVNKALWIERVADLAGVGRRAQVDVGGCPSIPSQQQVPNHPTDQVQGMPGRDEGLGQWPNLLEQRLDAVGNHPRKLRIHTAWPPETLRRRADR